MRTAGATVTIDIGAAHAIAGSLDVAAAVSLELLSCMRQGLRTAMEKRADNG